MAVRQSDKTIEFNCFDTLLNAAIAILRMAQLAAPCTGPECQVAVAIETVKACRLGPVRWSWDQSKVQSVKEEIK